MSSNSNFLFIKKIKNKNMLKGNITLKEWFIILSNSY